MLLLYNKIDQAVLNDLNLPGNKPTTRAELLPIEPAKSISPTRRAKLLAQSYNSLQLIDRILEDNRTNPELGDLRTKAIKEGENT